MLASMSEIDPHADTPLMDWSQLDVSGLLPTGTVTLLLATSRAPPGCGKPSPRR